MLKPGGKMPRNNRHLRLSSWWHCSQRALVAMRPGGSDVDHAEILKKIVGTEVCAVGLFF